MTTPQIGVRLAVTAWILIDPDVHLGPFPLKKIILQSENVLVDLEWLMARTASITLRKQARGGHPTTPSHNGQHTF